MVYMFFLSIVFLWIFRTLFYGDWTLCDIHRSLCYNTTVILSCFRLTLFFGLAAEQPITADLVLEREEFKPAVFQLCADDHKVQIHSCYVSIHIYLFYRKSAF